MTVNENCKTISTKDLIILCEIFKDYKAFYDDIEVLIKSKTNRDLIYKLYKYILKTIRKEKILFVDKKYDAFIKKHKHTIETIEKYNYLHRYTYLEYTAKGRRCNSIGDSEYFYQYLEEHKEDIETIKRLALKIKELGIVSITFGEHLDFTTAEHILYTSDTHCEFTFLENMEIIPTYQDNSIKYRAVLSPYCIYLNLINSYGITDDIISEYDRKIYLNSLTFNPDRLPNEITTESTIGVITSLADKKKEEFKDLNDSVDLSIATDNLKKEFESLKKSYENVNKIKDNQELRNLLTQMQNIIVKLQLFETDFEQQVIDSYPDLSEDIIKKEKNAELDRRSR